MTNFLRLIAEASETDDKTFNGERYVHLSNGGVKYTGLGTTIYWKGKIGAIRHRLDGPAFVDEKNGIVEWWVDGKLHRVDGPAVVNEKEGSEKWFLNGILHRTDGPAIKYKIGYDYEEYWVHGKHFTKEEFYKHFGNE